MSDHRTGFVPYPHDLAEHYRSAGFWTGQPLDQTLRSSARTHPDAKAVIGHRSMSYRELDHAADRFAGGLCTLGIRAGDRVVMHMPNIPEFAVALFGVLRAAAIPVLTLPAHRRADIEHLARLSGAKAYLAADRGADGFDYRELADTLLAEIPSMQHAIIHGDPGGHTTFADVATAPVGPLPQIDPSDIAVLLVSGGTTGSPKLIARTHNDYYYNARASAEACALTASDVYLTALPAAHNFPLACPGILGTVAAGGTVVFSDDPSPENVFELIERHRVTITAVVPPLAQVWCAATEWEQADLSSLRLLQVGGAAPTESLARGVPERLGAQLQQVFGMAEGLVNYTRLDDPQDLIATTQGRPLSPADRIRIVDADGHDVAPGAEGELITQGPYTIRGYYRADAHNARAFTPDGWYRSGDLVRRLPSGHLVVSGRIKDVINRAGENISCDEVEEHLLAHPDVVAAAVVGLPDSALGQRVCAALVVDGRTPTTADLSAFLTARGLARFKHPEVVRRLDALPTTAVGKIDRRALTTTTA